jgi:hypothetical protein
LTPNHSTSLRQVQQYELSIIAPWQSALSLERGAYPLEALLIVSLAWSLRRGRSTLSSFARACTLQTPPGVQALFPAGNRAER